MLIENEIELVAPNITLSQFYKLIHHLLTILNICNTGQSEACKPSIEQLDDIN